MSMSMSGRRNAILQDEDDKRQFVDIILLFNWISDFI